MKKWSTIIHAKNPLTGNVSVFDGPLIEAPTQKLAFEYCQNNGLGYCFIGDEVISIIPTKADGLTPDWSKRTDFDIEQNN
jgi:hypothetical protein